MSSKLFNLYTKQLHSIFDKISSVLEAISSSSISNEEYNTMLNELDINLRECDKKFQQMDFEYLTMRSTVQKETIANSINQSKEIYENYKERIHSLKGHHKQPLTYSNSDYKKPNNTKDQYQPQVQHQQQQRNIIKEDKVNRAYHQQAKQQPKPKEIKEPSWLAKEQYHNKKEEEINNLECYRIPINDDEEGSSKSTNDKLKQKEVSDNKQNDKYSKNKLSRFYKLKMIFSQLNLKSPGLLRIGIVIIIIVIYCAGMIFYFNYNQNMPSRPSPIPHVILRPDEVITNLNHPK